MLNALVRFEFSVNFPEGKEITAYKHATNYEQKIRTKDEVT